MLPHELLNHVLIQSLWLMLTLTPQQTYYSGIFIAVPGELCRFVIIEVVHWNYVLVLQLECLGIYGNLLQEGVCLGIMLEFRGCDKASPFLTSECLKEAHVNVFLADKTNTVLVLPDELFMLTKHREQKWLLLLRVPRRVCM